MLSDKKICTGNFWKAAVLGTFESQGRCTNWRGYRQAINARFEDAQYWDLINDDWGSILSGVIEFNPDFLFILLPDGLKLDIKKIKRETNCITIFHYMDYNPNLEQVPLDVSKPDIMFLSNKDQIPEYKSKFGLEEVHFCPIACYEYKGKLPYNPEHADKIIFVGSVPSEAHQEEIHYHRTKFFHELEEVFEERIICINEPLYPARNDIYDKLPEIYNSCGYALSMDAYYPEMDGYTSNRVWAIMNFKGLPLIQEWKGMEEFGLEDGKTCISFKPWDLHAFAEKIRHYDMYPEKRTAIKEEAFKVGRLLNTTHKRLDKIMEVISAKFINSDIPLL